MKKKIVIAAAIMGVCMSLSGIIGGSSVMAAPSGSQWVCPNGYTDCPGQEYCSAHDQCVADGYCSHNNCRTGYGTTTTTGTSRGYGHHGGGCGGGRHHR